MRAWRSMETWELARAVSGNADALRRLAGSAFEATVDRPARQRPRRLVTPDRRGDPPSWDPDRRSPSALAREVGWTEGELRKRLVHALEASAAPPAPDPPDPWQKTNPRLALPYEIRRLRGDVDVDTIARRAKVRPHLWRSLERGESPSRVNLDRAVHVLGNTPDLQHLAAASRERNRARERFSGHALSSFRLRYGHEVPIGALALRTGLTTRGLSYIERGTADSDYGTGHRVADGLGLDRRAMRHSGFVLLRASRRWSVNRAAYSLGVSPAVIALLERGLPPGKLTSAIDHTFGSNAYERASRLRSNGSVDDLAWGSWEVLAGRLSLGMKHTEMVSWLRERGLEVSQGTLSRIETHDLRNPTVGTLQLIDAARKAIDRELRASGKASESLFDASVRVARHADRLLDVPVRGRRQSAETRVGR